MMVKYFISGVAPDSSGHKILGPAEDHRVKEWRFKLQEALSGKETVKGNVRCVPHSYCVSSLTFLMVSGRMCTCATRSSRLWKATRCRSLNWLLPRSEG